MMTHRSAGPESIAAPGILWIASYPNSGNTWYRAFLTNLLRAADRPVGINDLDVRWIASSRQLLDELYGVESADLTEDEIARLRPRLYSSLARHTPELLTIKIHDAYQRRDGEIVIPADATRGVIVIVRNPLDVVVSIAHQGSRPVTEVIDRMADEDDALGGPGRLQLRQHLGSWSSHVLGWADAAEVPVHLVRYEDMSRTPQQTFAASVAFAGLRAGAARLARALEFSRFEELRRQEREVGFHERSPRSSRFFRQGRIGGWRDELNDGDVARVIERHGAAMQRFGYLAASGEPAF